MEPYKTFYVKTERYGGVVIDVWQHASMEFYAKARHDESLPLTQNPGAPMAQSAQAAVDELVRLINRS